MSKKAKPIQQLYEEYTSKHRTMGAWEYAPVYAKKIGDVIGAQSKSPLPNILLVEAEIEKNNLPEVAKNLTTAIQAFPNDPVLLYQSAQYELINKRYQSALGKLDESNSQYQQVSANAANNDVTVHLLLFKALPTLIIALRFKIFIEMDKKDALTACPLYDLSAQTVNSFDIMSLRRIQDVMIDYAVLKRNQGDFTTAYSLLRSFFANKVTMPREIALRSLREISNILLFDYPPYSSTNQQISIVEEASHVLLILENLLKGHPNINLKLDPYYASIYEDMCNLLASLKQYKALIKVLERGVARHYESRSMWFQFALVLVQDEQYTRAYKTLTECESMSNAILELTSLDEISFSERVEVANILLLKCKVCLKLDKPDEAVKLANNCKRLVPEKHLLSVKLNEYLSIANYAMVSRVALLSEKQNYQKLSLECIQKAYQLDKQNPSVLYHMAYVYAQIRDTRKAFAYVKKAIQVMYDQEESTKLLHDAYLLLVLLFTCEKDYVNALKAVKLGKSEFHHSITLQYMSRRLEDICKELGLTPKAREDEKATFSVSWEKLFQSWTEMLKSKYATQDASTPANPLQPNASANPTANNEGSLPALKSKEGLSKLEQYTVWVAEAMRKNQEANKAMLLCRSMADLYKKESLVPTAQLLYMTGYLNEEAKRYDAAMSDYESALLRDAHHKYALLRMGMLQWKHGKQLIVAKSYLQTAVRVDPQFHEAWHQLGCLMRESGDLDDASECFMTALKLEKTAPMISFESIIKFHI